MPEGVFQCRQADPFTRMAGNLDDFQTKPFAGLQPGVEGWGFNRNQITGLGYRLQAEIQPFHRTGCNDNFLWRNRCPLSQVAQSQLSPQFLITRGQICHSGQWVELAGCGC